MTHILQCSEFCAYFLYRKIERNMEGMTLRDVLSHWNLIQKEGSRKRYIERLSSSDFTLDLRKKDVKKYEGISSLESHTRGPDEVWEVLAHWILTSLLRRRIGRSRGSFCSLTLDPCTGRPREIRKGSAHRRRAEKRGC